MTSRNRTVPRARRWMMLALAGTGLLLFAGPSTAAYDAQIGWLPVAGATGYRVFVGFDGQAARGADIGNLAPEPDGTCRVVFADLPLGPTAQFSVTSYDENSIESPPSNFLSIAYRDAAAVVDSDGDGLFDAQEDEDLDQIVDSGETDPSKADTDGDGINDGDEVTAGSDPTDAASPGAGCEIATCDDANACNGIEHCEVGIGCVAGEAPACDNGVYCDGVERCDPALGCVGAPAPDCSDSIACTEDICDTAADACTNIPRADRCDDGNICTEDTCSPTAGCTATSNTATCDDGLACTSGDVCTNGNCSGSENCPVGQVCGPATGTCESGDADSDNDGLTNEDDPCPDDARNGCFGPVALDRSHDSIIRINSSPSSSDCAGHRTDCNGDVWGTDFGYHESARSRACNQRRDEWQCNIQGVTELFGCTSEQTLDLFRCTTSEWDENAPSSYSFDVPRGRYLLNLYFANVRRSGDSVGASVFDIVVENETAYADFDPVAVAGSTETALVRSVVVVVDDNGLQVSFKATQGKTAVNAVELLAEP